LLHHEPCLFLHSLSKVQSQSQEQMLKFTSKINLLL
jgi:hypothetical protein